MRRAALFLAAAALGPLFFSSLPARGGVCDGISPASAGPLTTLRVASGLLRPLFVIAPPGDVDRLFILEQDGRIRILKGGVLSTFLDVSAITRSPADVGGGNEEGLLGLAFPADYATSGRFFIYHTDNSGNNLVARYARLDPDTADPLSRQVVISFAHPVNTNHNGGMIAFGLNDGYLYIATGDGGGSCDAPGNAQNGASMLGKLLRIDVSSLPYTVPSDNPFVGPDAFNDEIWSYGLRNPWRFSFDRANADLYVGDVGQSVWEEIDYATAASRGGENYGWDWYEGDHCPNPSCGAQGPDCNLPAYVKPLFEYNQTGTPCAVTGGNVYRGCRMPSLAGTYFYSDFCAAFLRTFQVVGGSVTNPIDRTAELAPGGGLTIDSVNSFGEDARGEIYVVDRGGLSPTTATGEIFKIVPVLASLEVSGTNAQPFQLQTDTWTWEDLGATSSHPIASYRVYRNDGNGSGVFACIHQGAANSWAGGDPAVPAADALYSYVVTAVNAAGTQASPGAATDGTPRSLSSAVCP